MCRILLYNFYGLNNHLFEFLEGLPSDELSIENAISIIQSHLSPYLIDPSSRAAEWLKTHLGSGEKPIEIANPKDDRYKDSLVVTELALYFDNPSSNASDA